MNSKICELLESIHIEFYNNNVMLIACVLKNSFHVFCTTGYSLQVFSTKILVLQCGDESVMIMTCVLKCSTCVF